MESLYLHIEYRSRIDINAVIVLDILCESDLILILDVHELLLSLLIVSVNLQSGNARQISDPLVADVICYPCSQKRIAVL